MTDEAAIGSTGPINRSGHSGGGSGEHPPLQARAAFFKNRSWESVVSFNRAACSRGGAQHGINSEAGASCEDRWRHLQLEEIALSEFGHEMC